MNDVQPLHHVFSSAGGYRTLYASQGLADDTVRTLESFASVSQRAYSRGASYACTSLPDESVALSCTFVHGADHVGRRRLCSHSIVLPGTIRAAEGFHPAAPPLAQFMTKDVPAERPGHFLSSRWPVPERKEIDAAQQEAFARLDELDAELMAALLSPTRTVVAAAPGGNGMVRLARVGWLLPREMRVELRYRSGAWPSEEVGRFGQVSAVLLAQAAELDAYDDGQFVHVDFFRAEAEDEELATAEGWGHPYVAFLLELRGAEHGARRLRAFLRLLSVNPGPVQPSFDQQSCLVKGYRLAEAALFEFAATGKVIRHTPELIASLSLLARSGRVGLAEVLVEHTRAAIPTTDRPTLKRSVAALHALLQDDFYLQGLELGRKLESYGKELRQAATVRQPQP